MPRAPKGPCTFPGCRRKAELGARCRKHRRAGEGHPDQDFYRSWIWRNLAAQVRAEEPACTCTTCSEHAGTPCGKPTTDADHIVAMTDGGPALERSNLRGLCGDCHMKKTWADRARRAQEAS